MSTHLLVVLSVVLAIVVIAVLAGAGVLFAVFLGGQWMTFHGDARDILERCKGSPALDPVTKVDYCPMWIVEGLPDPTPPPLAARR